MNLHHPLFFSFGVLVAISSPVFPASQPFTKATFTQVVNDVSIVKTSTNQRFRAAPNVAVQAPDVVATGIQSRAELQWPDATLTRVGANTVFSFSSDDRHINIKQGSLLFHSPAGKGGGTIQTAAATAAITGTTIIISCTLDGGFKFLVLEGRGNARLPNGRRVTLKAGQLVYILAGAKRFSPVFNYRLLEQTGDSNLVEGFSGDLPSLEKINDAIAGQEQQIQTGTLGITGFLAGDLATETTVTVVDPNSIQPRTSGSSNRFVVAFNTDHVISTPLLDLAYTGPAEEALPVFSAITGYQLDEDDEGPAPGTLGFGGRNILFTTPTVDLTDLTTPSTGFGFLATESITLPPSLTILSNGDPYNEESGIAFISPTIDAQSINHANGDIEIEAMQLTVAPGSTLSAGGDIDLETEQALTLQNVNLVCANGSPWVFSGGNLDLIGGSLQGNPSYYEGVSAQSAYNLSVQGTLFSGSQAFLEAGNDLTLDAADFSGIAGDFNVNAGQTATLRNLNLNSLSYVSISARTVVVENVTFATGTPVNINCESGLWVGAASAGALPGGIINPLKANFINSSHGGTPLVGSGGTGPVLGTGVNVGTFGP
jgi:hypothetical protein